MSEQNWLWNHPSFQKTKLFQELKQEPLGFIDVGARGEVHPYVAPLAQGTAVLGFEPDPEGYAELKKMAHPGWAQVVMEPVGLGHQTGPATLYQFTAPTNNSLRNTRELYTKRYNMEKWLLASTSPVEVVTLDQVLAKRQGDGVTWGEFLKVDTQGTENDILLGAEKTLLETTVAVVAELEFFQIYEDQVLFSQVTQNMHNLGFSFYGFTNMFVRSGKRVPASIPQRERWFYGDAVFLKDPFDRGLTLTPRQATALTTSALLLGYFDLALELTETYQAQDQVVMKEICQAFAPHIAERGVQLR